MKDVKVPVPNPFVTAWLVGPECHRIMASSADLVMALWQAQVARRSGRLADSAHTEVTIGGLTHDDRWVARLVVGGPDAPHAASHEFGTRHQAGAHDLNHVLNQLAAM